MLISQKTSEHIVSLKLFSQNDFSLVWFFLFSSFFVLRLFYIYDFFFSPHFCFVPLSVLFPTDLTDRTRDKPTRNTHVSQTKVRGKTKLTLVLFFDVQVNHWNTFSDVTWVTSFHRHFWVSKKGRGEERHLYNLPHSAQFLCVVCFIGYHFGSHSFSLLYQQLPISWSTSQCIR